MHGPLTIACYKPGRSLVGPNARLDGWLWAARLSVPILFYSIGVVMRQGMRGAWRVAPGMKEDCSSG